MHSGYYEPPGWLIDDLLVRGFPVREYDGLLLDTARIGRNWRMNSAWFYPKFETFIQNCRMSP